MTAVVVVALLLGLALVDGACSGFRSALGRTGLIRRGSHDRQATALGVLLVLICLVPAALAFAVDVAVFGTPAGAYVAAGKAMLVVLLPYAVVVGLALGAYALLSWQQKYLAMAAILGPFTLARPLIALGSGIAGACASDSGSVMIPIVLAIVAVLVVEPLAGRRWSLPM